MPTRSAAAETTTIRARNLPDWFWEAYRPILLRYALGGLGVVMISHPPGTGDYVTLKLDKMPDGEIVVSPNGKRDIKTFDRWSNARE